MEIYVNVKNFGKIKEARVNISNFTIFVGNNNSGKTQLMELIYIILKKISTLNPDIHTQKIGDLDAFHIGKDEIRYLNEWINLYLANNIEEIIEENFNSAIPIEEISLDFEEIDNNYDVYFLTDRTLEYLLKRNLLEEKILTEFVANKQDYYGTLVLKHGSDGSIEGDTKTRFSSTIPLNIAKKIKMGDILGELIGVKAPVASNILFLPASRMGLMLLYKHYFGSTSQDKSELIREKNQNSKGITKPVLDFLSFLLKYSYTERIAKKNEDLIDFIFSNLIDGTISEKGDMTVYKPKEQEKEIPVFVASSMVNEVVPVIKALTDSDQIDFLFYDEVETSMHPLKQIEMVRLLNRLNNKGIKLLVSTHSDTMATKMNNLLLLSHGTVDFQKTKTVLEKHGVLLEKEDLLISKNIHVYQFMNTEEGKSIVEELEFKEVPCIGYDFSLFNDSSSDLFEEAKIAMRIGNED